jgi:uncharacterized protein YecE (DUF72 family)
MLYIGCPQWGSTHWKGRFFSSQCPANKMLTEYASMFNTVEGNTSFYADPSSASIKNWTESVDEHFKFTFKIPKRFSHDMALQHCQSEILKWLRLFEPILPKVGQIMLQLPKSCGPEYLLRIEQFCQLLPNDISLGIEVRHLGFFDKQHNEQAFNQMLIKHNYNRIMMDTRPLFNEPANTQAIIDAQRKKPKVPLHVIATSNSPIIRYVGCSALKNNQPFYQPWLKKITQWVNEGKTPYVFFHTADNFDSPILARQFVKDLNIEHKVLSPFPSEREAKQSCLF